MDLMSLVDDDTMSVVSAASARAAGTPGDPGGSSDSFEIPPDITDPTLLARLRLGLDISNTGFDGQDLLACLVREINPE